MNGVTPGAHIRSSSDSCLFQKQTQIAQIAQTNAENH